MNITAKLVSLAIIAFIVGFLAWLIQPARMRRLTKSIRSHAYLLGLRCRRLEEPPGFGIKAKRKVTVTRRQSSLRLGVVQVEIFWKAGEVQNHFPRRSVLMFYGQMN